MVYSLYQYMPMFTSEHPFMLNTTWCNSCIALHSYLLILLKSFCSFNNIIAMSFWKIWCIVQYEWMKITFRFHYVCFHFRLCLMKMFICCKSSFKWIFSIKLIQLYLSLGFCCVIGADIDFGGAEGLLGWWMTFPPPSRGTYACQI